VKETILDGILRETQEELGGEIRVRPLGAVHVQTFHYYEKVRYMIAINFLLAYEGGEVHPGDDMEGSQYRWWSLAEFEDENVKVVVPPGQKWLLKRAIGLYWLWKDQRITLQLQQL
jgi:ADP-ribose pyrophosphatase YjhB (NUDIX family)